MRTAVHREIVVATDRPFDVRTGKTEKALTETELMNNTLWPDSLPRWWDTGENPTGFHYTSTEHRVQNGREWFSRLYSYESIDRTVKVVGRLYDADGRMLTDYSIVKDDGGVTDRVHPVGRSLSHRVILKLYRRRVNLVPSSPARAVSGGMCNTWQTLLHTYRLDPNRETITEYWKTQHKWLEINNNYDEHWPVYRLCAIPKANTIEFPPLTSGTRSTTASSYHVQLWSNIFGDSTSDGFDIHAAVDGGTATCTATRTTECTDRWRTVLYGTWFERPDDGNHSTVAKFQITGYTKDIMVGIVAETFENHVRDTLLQSDDTSLKNIHLMLDRSNSKYDLKRYVAIKDATSLIVEIGLFWDSMTMRIQYSELDDSKLDSTDIDISDMTSKRVCFAVSTNDTSGQCTFTGMSVGDSGQPIDSNMLRDDICDQQLPRDTHTCSWSWEILRISPSPFL